MTSYQGISGNRENLHASKYMANVWPNEKQDDFYEHLIKSDDVICSESPYKYTGTEDVIDVKTKLKFICDATLVVVFNLYHT